ncbi:MAG: hypothetical protein QW594_01985 [Candidatus Woesearchaeota archaeon]
MELNRKNRFLFFALIFFIIIVLILLEVTIKSYANGGGGGNNPGNTEGGGTSSGSEGSNSNTDTQQSNNQGNNVNSNSNLQSNQNSGSTASTIPEWWNSYQQFYKPYQKAKSMSIFEEMIESKLNVTLMLNFLFTFFNDVAQGIDQSAAFLEKTNLFGLGKMNENAKKKLQKSLADKPYNFVEDLYLLGSGNYVFAKCYQDYKGSALINEQGTGFVSGGNFPQVSGRAFAYVYGRRTSPIYEHEYQIPYNTSYRVDGKKPHWFYLDKDKPLGYLYTISWNFQHPYSAEQIQAMSESERINNGMDKNGNIYYRLVFTVDGSGDPELTRKQIMKGKVRSISPGGIGKETISFYNKIYFTKVYLEFSEIDDKGKSLATPFTYQGSRQFPKTINCEEEQLQGCFREVSAKAFPGLTITPLSTTSSDGGSGTNFGGSANYGGGTHGVGTGTGGSSSGTTSRDPNGDFGRGGSI